MTADSLNNLFIFVKSERRSAAHLYTFLNYPACKSHHMALSYVQIGLSGYAVFLVIILQKARFSGKCIGHEMRFDFLYNSR